VVAVGGKLILCAGAPTATVDDEERMLLAMRDVADGERPIPVRVGVNRGPVFVATLGPSYRRTYTVMGDAVNLAARLMARARPGEVYVTSSVLERSATAFTTTALEPFTVKGKARPVSAWSLGPPLGRQARAEARTIDERFPLVGRETEMAVLLQAVANARAGAGELVEIVSEPGLGKTRLLEELEDAAPELRRLAGSCEAYTASVPYRAWREPLLQALGTPVDADAASIVAELTVAVAAADPELMPWLPLLAAPFDVHVSETAEVRRIAAEFRPARVQESVIRLLRALLPEPALILFEDVHLMDRASADLLTALARQLPETPWLVAATRRDEETGFVAPSIAGVVHLEPAPLSPDDTLALAEAVTERSPIPPSTLAQVAERSAGSPQFLRDLLRAVADGVEDLPDSIEAAAMARIDRLSRGDRALVRRVAVLGLNFDTRLVPLVLDDDMPPPDASTWQRLWRYFADDGGGRRRFRRAVVREVAYAGLPFSQRRRLHGVVGAHLADELGSALFDQAAILSLHFLEAGDYASAWHFAREAGDRARREYAHADAAALYRRALEASRNLDVPATELAAVWEALGEAYSRTGEPRAAASAFAAARRLAGDDPLRQAELLHRHAVLDFEAGKVPQAVRWTMRGLRAVDGLEQREARARRANLLATLATVRWRAGAYGTSSALARRAIADAEAAGDDEALARACMMLDTAEAYAGGTVQGEHFRRALAIYERLGDLDRQAAVLNNMGIAAYWAGRWDEAVELYGRGADACRAAGDASNAAFGDGNIGEVLSDQGRVEEAEQMLRRALRIFRGTGYEWNATYVIALLGRAATRAGDLARAHELLDNAVATFTALGIAGDAAWADALRAEAAVHATDGEAALERADRLLLDHAGTGRLAPLLHRIRGIALGQMGNFAAAEGALGASLAEARIQAEAYEIAVTLHALLALQLHAGRRPDPSQILERDRLFTRLGVERVPLPPLAPTGMASGATRASG
jgi:tetratricopeptide (TPR) repeat protein